MTTTYSYGTWNDIDVTVEDFRGSRFLDLLMHEVTPNGMSLPPFEAMDDDMLSDHGCGCVVAEADVDGEELISGHKLGHVQIILKRDWGDRWRTGHCYYVGVSVEWNGDGSRWSWGNEDIVCVYGETMDCDDDDALYKHLYDVLREVL